MNSFDLPADANNRVIAYIPASLPCISTCIIQTYRNRPVIHLNELVAANPGSDVYVVDDLRLEPSRIGGVNDVWRHGDRAHRYIWRLLRDHIHAQSVTFLEHDLLATCELPVVGYNTVITEWYRPGPNKNPNESWKDLGWFWPEADRLPLYLKQCAHSEMGCITTLSRDVLDKISDKKWDFLYDLDVHAEIRRPTLYKYLGINIYNYSELESFKGNIVRIHCISIDPVSEANIFKAVLNNTPGIYHPLKPECYEEPYSNKIFKSSIFKPE